MGKATRTSLTAVATGLATVLLATSASAAPGPGAPGLGDSYYPGAGNGGYDVSHYDIRLTYQPDTDRLAGTTTILARTTQELSSFNLDFGLQVDSVRVNNRPARFTKDPDDFSELVVTPRKPLRDGQFMHVVVRYADTPSKVTIDDYEAWKKTETGALAVDQPIISEWWFPANDHPTDKATFDVSIEVPDDVSALSNGTLERQRKTRHGWTRWDWRSTEPQATYLAFMVIGDYEVQSSVSPSGRPFIRAYDPLLGNSLPAAKASIERAPEVVEFLEGVYGQPYPFEAQGGIATVGLGFALETQTRPVYDAAFFRSGSNMSVVVHEEAHQWFGNSVALGDWSAIWLNEGFASYAELMWSEHVGEGTADELAEYLYDVYPADDEFWQTLPGDPGADNQFHPAVYDRGAMTVHALRKAVGDDAFFKIMRTWLAQKKDSHGTTPEFIAHAEEVSGQQLDELFETWLFTPSKPPQSPNGPGAATLGTAAQPESYPEIAFTHRQLATGR